MNDFFTQLTKRQILLPDKVHNVLSSCKYFRVFDSVEQLSIAAVGGEQQSCYEVAYDIPGKGLVSEAVVHKVKNGISVNYTEAYMRRR
ncbi:MAG: DUF4914 family protein, partial [Bacteroidales bacterium]|nr:DUF4914 family protein [Bacteroidales bacterium]MDD4641798.1 DUF4914 family protein [Bacteroidales bacterium]